jgi:SH3 domain protein
MTIRNTVFRYIAQCLLLAILGPASVASAETMYVSDELTIPMRSGTSDQYRIVSFLPSGTALEVLEPSPDGSYQHVKVDDKDGWVKTEQLMKAPAARAQLVTLNQRIESLKAQLKQSGGSIAELNAQIKQLENDKSALEKSRDDMATSLNHLKQVAANPAAIAQQNKALEDKLASLDAEFSAVQAENAHLRNRDIKEWFMIGGGVSLLSLFFGLIIPNIKWRKRDSWSGGF